MNIKPILINKSKKTGLSKLCIKIDFYGDTNKRVRKYIQLPYEINEKYFKNGKVLKSYPNSSKINEVIQNEVFNITQQLNTAKNINEISVTQNQIKTPQKTLVQLLEELKDINQGKEIFKKLRQLQTYLNDVSEALYIEDINQALINRLEGILIKKYNLQPSTIYRTFKTLKLFFGYLYSNDIISFKYKTFKYPKDVDKEIIVLYKDEINLLLSTTLKTPYQERIRKLFIIQCFTGVRYSDLMQINKNRIEDNYIKIQTKKNKKLITVPILKQAKDILETIDYDIKKILISNQKYNKFVKEVCEAVGIDKEIEIVKYYNGKPKHIRVKKYEVISSHTARRTFITNAIIAGVPLPIVQSISGHSSLAVMQKYISIADNQKNEMEKLQNLFL